MLSPIEDEGTDGGGRAPVPSGSLVFVAARPTPAPPPVIEHAGASVILITKLRGRPMIERAVVLIVLACLLGAACRRDSEVPQDADEAVVASRPTGDASDIVAQCRNLLPGRCSAAADVRLTRQQDGWRIASLRCEFIRGEDVTDVNLRFLRNLASVESVQIDSYWGTQEGYFSRLSPQGFRNLAVLHLRRFVFPWSTTDAGVQAICSLRELEDLQLGSFGSTEEALGDRGLAHLRELTNLRRLALSGAELGAASLDSIGSLSRLEELDLHLSKVMTETAVARLRGLQRLRLLSLATLNAEDLTALQVLPALEHLDVDRVEAADLSVLAGLKRLRVSDPGDGTSEPIRLPETLRELTLPHSTVAALDLKSCRNIERVRIDVDRHWDDDGRPRSLRWLKSLPKLTHLSLVGAVDQDVKAIAGLSSLRALTLSGACAVKLGDEGLRALAGWRQLESLEICEYGAWVSDAGLDVLRNFGKLTRLDLSGCLETPANGHAVTPKGLGGIGELNQLRVLKLDLSTEPSMDEVLARFPLLANLEDLTISGSVTDQRLRMLEGLKKLRRLDLSGSTGYTDDGLRVLLAAVPSLLDVEFELSERH